LVQDGSGQKSNEWGEAWRGSGRLKDQEALKGAVAARQEEGRVTAPRPVPHLWPRLTITTLSVALLLVSVLKTTYDQVPTCLTYSSTETVSFSETSSNFYWTKHRIECQKIILFVVTVQGSFTAEDSSDPIGYCDLEHLTGYVELKKKTIISWYIILDVIYLF
jgi:hypothetical protein